MPDTFSTQESKKISKGPLVRKMNRVRPYFSNFYVICGFCVKCGLLMPSFAEELPVAWVMGSGHFFYCSGWAGQVSHLWFGSEFGNKFPLKIPNFLHFFSVYQKVPRSKMGKPLIY